MLRGLSLTLTTTCIFDVWMVMEFDFTEEWPALMVFALRFILLSINFTLLLLVIFSTYPMQVGLFDVVAKHSRPVLAAHVSYFISTCLISFSYYRYSGVTGMQMGIWYSSYQQTHTIFFVIHRVCAMMYYLLTYRCCVEFMNPKYRDKAAWISIAKERYNLHSVEN